MTKYDKALQSGTKEYEQARKPDRPNPAVKREVRRAAATQKKQARASHAESSADPRLADR